MVWARTKLTILDYLYPYQWVVIEHRGKNVQQVYKKIQEALVNIFRVPWDNIHERIYDWRRTERGEEFKVEWEAFRQFDNFTYLRIEVRLNGFVGKDGVGYVRIRYRPALITEYPQDTFWQQSIFYEMLRRLWHVIFYRRRRNEYYMLARELSEQFDREIKAFLEKLGG